MVDGSGTLHEPRELLSRKTIERHRALVSLAEELEAINWYDQRIDASEDEELKAILAHNRDEEREHASMLLEWLRRNSAEWDSKLRQYLFTSQPIVQEEAQANNSGPGVSEQGSDRPGGRNEDSLGVGGLQGEGML